MPAPIERSSGSGGPQGPAQNQGITILESDGRLRELVKSMGKEPHHTSLSMCPCAAALCKVWQTCATAADISLNPNEELKQRKNVAVRVALVVDSSMIPRRRKTREPDAYHFDPSVELDMSAAKEYPCRNSNAFKATTTSVTIAIGGGSVPGLKKRFERAKAFLNEAAVRRPSC